MKNVIAAVCGVLCAFVTGFVFNHPFQHMYDANHSAAGLTLAIIEVGTAVIGFIVVRAALR